MKRLLLRYGQECILLDATYKVLRYKRTTGSHYPQFLLAVPTNDGYQVGLDLSKNNFLHFYYVKTAPKETYENETRVEVVFKLGHRADDFSAF